MDNVPESNPQKRVKTSYSGYGPSPPLANAGIGSGSSGTAGQTDLPTATTNLPAQSSGSTATLDPRIASSQEVLPVPSYPQAQVNAATALPISQAAARGPTLPHSFDDNEGQEDGDEDAQVDHDSTYDNSSLRDETETLASYITHYRWENGRRYHAYGSPYWGPNDEDANDHQDLAHHLYRLTLDDKLHLAPLKNPHNILDLGTGTGIWCIEMADLYPSAHVIGTDLSPIQPRFVPPNCSFEIEDLTLEWTFPENKFDFIHVRELFGCIADWDEFFRQTYRTVKPGGYVEICEHAVTPVADDDTAGPDCFYTLWGKTVIGLGNKTGKTFEIWKESKERLERAGFVDVVETRYKWPMNGWHRDPKLNELGRWNQLRLYDGVEGYMIRLLTMVGGWTKKDADDFLNQMRSSLLDKKIHAYLDVSVVYGRKPQ